MAETIADRIRKVRGTLNQEQFGTRLGVHKNTISNYERDREPDAYFCRAVRREYGVSIDWLLTGEGPMMAASPDTSGLRKQLAALLALKGELSYSLEQAIVMMGFSLAELEGMPVARDLQMIRNTIAHGMAVNTDALAGAMAAVEELIAERRVTLAPEKKAKLVSLVYNQLTKSPAGRQIERGDIENLLDLAS